MKWINGTLVNLGGMQACDLVLEKTHPIGKLQQVWNQHKVLVTTRILRSSHRVYTPRRSSWIGGPSCHLGWRIFPLLPQFPFYRGIPKRWMLTLTCTASVQRRSCIVSHSGGESEHSSLWWHRRIRILPPSLPCLWPRQPAVGGRENTSTTITKSGTCCCEFEIYWDLPHWRRW